LVPLQSFGHSLTTASAAPLTTSEATTIAPQQQHCSAHAAYLA
jgi:hypothetical protein